MAITGLTQSDAEQLLLELGGLEDAEQPAGRALTPEEALQLSQSARHKFESTATAEAVWLKDYFELVALGWKWRVAAYIAWAASPREARWPETQELLATQVLGLTSDRMIREWREKNPAIEATIARWKAGPLLKFRAAAFEALGQSASTPDYRHKADRQLFFEMTGDHVNRQVIDDQREAAPVTADEMERARKKAEAVEKGLNGDPSGA